MRRDWSQSTDLSAANPGEVKGMRDLMFAEFSKYQVSRSTLGDDADGDPAPT